MTIAVGAMHPSISHDTSQCTCLAQQRREVAETLRDVSYGQSFSSVKNNAAPPANLSRNRRTQR